MSCLTVAIIISFSHLAWDEVFVFFDFSHACRALSAFSAAEEAAVAGMTGSALNNYASDRVSAWPWAQGL